MYSRTAIDINCDVGEGIGNEASLMPHISSCNIACGAHAGTIEIIDEVIALTQKYKVKIGAHPSFPDRENFGRKVIKMSPDSLQKSIEEQIELLMKRADLQQVKLHHIKPHGALYNLIVKDKNTAFTVVKAVQNTIPHAYLYVPFASEIEKIAMQNGLKIKYEAFADRNYNPDLSLVSRLEKNALLTQKEDVLDHIEQIVLKNKVRTIEGFKTIKAETICVHGDTNNAVELVAYIHQHLTNKHIKIG